MIREVQKVFDQWFRLILLIRLYNFISGLCKLKIVPSNSISYFLILQDCWSWKRCYPQIRGSFRSSHRYTSPTVPTLIFSRGVQVLGWIILERSRSLVFFFSNYDYTYFHLQFTNVLQVFPHQSFKLWK